MTVEQLNIAFQHRLPIVLKKPNAPIIRYKEILYIEYSRQRKGNIHVNACLVDEVAPSSFTVAELRYIEPCLNDTPDDDGETYSFNTSEPDYENTRPLHIDERIKKIFTERRPVVATIKANRIPTETQQKLLGCVMNVDRELTLKFPEIKRLKIFLDQNREPLLYCDFDIGVDIPSADVRVCGG